MKLILFCRLLASLRRQKLSRILQFATLKDQISVLGGVMVPIVDVECLERCRAMIKVGLSRFQKPIEELAKRVSRIVLKTSGKFIQPESGK